MMLRGLCMAVELLPISAVDFAEFTQAFNLAYSDYYVAISMSVPAFRALFERDDIDPDASVAAVDAGRIVGTGLLGIRGQDGWIGGMGVIPDRRRQGIGQAMMEHLIRQARARNLHHLDLEVIEANRGAQALYRALGFENRRFLLILERTPERVPDILPECPLGETDALSVLDQYDAFHPVPNCWQRARSSLQAMAASLQSWTLNGEDGLQSYALGYADSSALRLIDLAAAPGKDAARSAACLLAALHRTYPGAHASSYNVADNDPVLPAFEALGYMVNFRQIEMRLEL